MKLHRNLALAVVSALELIFNEKKVAARALEQLFARNPKWGKRDRAFVAQTVYEIVRWRRLLEFGAQSADSWALLAAQLIRSEQEWPAWSEFSNFDGAEIRLRLQRPDLRRAIRESLPDWLDDFGESQLGTRWDAEIHALNAEAPVVLRANALKISRDRLKMRLEAENIAADAIENVPDALQLCQRRSISQIALYKEGFFEWQDAASQLVAPFLQVENGLKVLDACAGAGGKSLHLAALMGNRGHIVACDAESEKLGELRRRASRSGVSCLETLAPEQLKARGQSFERILMDAPCSGSGTLRRQPDLKWRLSPDFLAQIQIKQREILEFYAPMLQNGGKLVYATCSIFPAENARQVEWFLNRNPDFEWEEQKVISPAATGFDGFFMARLRRVKGVSKEVCVAANPFAAS